MFWPDGLLPTNTRKELLSERGKSCFGDLFVFFGRRKARSDTADHLAVDDNRKPALHLDAISK
jgi:hypothetical protein